MTRIIRGAIPITLIIRIPTNNRQSMLTCQMIRKLYILVVISLITGCATTAVFDTTGVDKSVTPHTVVNGPGDKGTTVLWGGTILSIKNLEDSTELEVLAYPLNTYHRPIIDSTPLGRFIIVHKGYLEPTTYAEGRSITALGKVAGTREGNVGDSKYTYAVMDSEQLQLWSKDRGGSRTNFHLGVGIVL
jgi:outer membrane lipoprotein